MHLKFQVPHYKTVYDVENLIKNKLKDYVNANTFANFDTDIPVRMWIMPDDTQPNILVNLLLAGCKANPTFTYKLFIEGQYMIPQQKLCDYDILKSSLILV